MIAVELVWPTAAILVVEEREIGRARASWADQEAAPLRGLIAVAARRVAPASAAAPAAEASAAAEPEVAEAGGAAAEVADADDKFDPDLEFSG